MKMIHIKGTDVALVDDEDFEFLSQFKWHLNGHRYACRNTSANGKRRYIPMHRAILGVCDGSIDVDHQNHNTLDNRRQNLRTCNASQNTANSVKQKGRSSKYKGTTWCKTYKKWKSQIMKNYKNYHLGYFAIEEDAARAYDSRASELYGEFALVNEVA